MNADLEQTLDELGPEYRRMVMAMKSAYEPMPPSVVERPRGRVLPWTFGYLAAAALLIFLGLGIVFRSDSEPSARVYTARVVPSANEFMLAHIRADAAIEEIIRTQRADGGWDNDFLTRQNAAALKVCKSEAAQVAFKRAVRNLRLRGAL